jgi:nitroimidazol reductase NimA-like FMN-containing flavoprotein (pyridoxamine 5'-phosphate oxidase superfamily)
MRRLDKEITNQDVLSEILNKSEICRLGFVDNGEAYIVPVNFAYADGVIYIHSAHEGRKMDLLKKNNRVTFEMEYFHEIVTGPKACNWTTRYRSVMGKGSICINNDIEVKKKGLDLIMRKYGAEIDLVYDEKILSRMTILILTIQSVTGKQSGDWK